MIWTNLNKVITENNSFLISSHENQDGDNIGSQLAFYKYLKSLGKEVFVYNKDKVPQKFEFFEDCKIISDVVPKQKFDVLVILDSSNPNRCGIKDIEKRFAKIVVNIDHHRDNTMFGDVNCVDTKSAAVCKILYDFFTENNISYGCDIANFLLCGIMTDSGGFQFSNDDGSLYLAARDLIEKGADNKMLFKKLFASNTIPAMKIRAKIWETMKFYANDKICVISMPKKLLSDFGADNSATDGMANMVLGGEGIEVGIFVRYDDKETHFSFRSAGTVDVGEIAATCDIGGGHKFAAGATMHTPNWEKSVENIIQKIEEKF